MDGHLALEIGFGIQAFVIVFLVVWLDRVSDRAANLEGRASKQDQLIEAIRNRTSDDTDAIRLQLKSWYEEDFENVEIRLVKSQDGLALLASEVNGLRERVLAQPGPAKVAEQNRPKRVSWGEMKRIASEQTAQQIQGAN